MALEIDKNRESELRENLLLTLDMFDTGVALYRARIRRENPQLTNEEVERRLIEWLSLIHI